MNKVRAILQRAFGLVKHHVGTDQFGNKYYFIPEQKTWTGQTFRKRRTVKTVCTKEYAYQMGDIPTEWDAWIRGRRKDPPTIEELLRNEKYREEIKAKGKKAYEKDKLLQDQEYKEGLVSEPAQTIIKGHASATYYGKNETSEDPTSTANTFEPGSWSPPGGSNRKT